MPFLSNCLAIAEAKPSGSLNNQILQGWLEILINVYSHSPCPVVVEFDTMWRSWLARGQYLSNLSHTPIA